MAKMLDLQVQIEIETGVCYKKLKVAKDTMLFH